MSPQELAFILKMHDEATATMKKIGQSLRGMGGDAKGAKSDTDKLGDSLDNLKKTATDAVAAFAGFKASFSGLKATGGAFNDYQAGIARVASVAGMGKQEMAEFSESFRQLNREIKVIPLNQLVEMEATLAQMGIPNQNLVKMGSTVAKLAMATDQAGDAVAEAAARIMYMAGEPIEDLEKFGDALSYLDRNAVATSKGILDMANNIAISMPNYKMSSRAVLAIATSMASAGMRSEITRSAFQRVMAALYQGSKKGSTAFNDFIKRVGMTKEEFDQLAATKPEEILLRFSDAYNAMADKGKGKDFLKQFNVQAQETELVLGVLGRRSQEVRDNLSLIDQGATKGDLQSRFDTVNQTQAADLSAMLKAWTDLKAAIGEAIAPLTTPILQGLTTGALALRDVFVELSPLTRGLIGAVITLGPAMLVAARAAALIRVAFAALAARGGLAAALLGAKSSMAAAGGVLGDVAGSAAGKTFGKTTQRMLSALKLVAKVALVIEGGKLLGEGIAAVINKYLPEQARAFADWRDNPDNAVGQAINWAGSKLGVQKGGSKWDKPQQVPGQAAANGGIPPVPTDLPPVDTETDTTGGKTISDIIKDYQAQIDEARALTGVAKERVEMEEAIRAAVKDTELGYDEVRKKLGPVIAELQKARAAAAVDEALRGYDDQINSARAVTGEEKLQVEVQKQINDLEREYGNITEANKQAIADKARAAFDAQRAVDYEKLIRETNQQLTQLTAVTQEEKDRASVIQQILEFEREHGRLSDQDREVLATKLMQLKQIAEFQRMADQYDPVGTARRRYEEELRTLETMRAQKVISEDQYSRMRQNLDERTRAQRDPVGDRVKTLREELGILRQNVDVQDRERSILQEINSLRQADVDLTGEQGQQMTQAVREYYTAMEEYKRASTQGIGGWINEVGTLRENMMGLTKDFASGLSGAISGALAGDKNAFRNFAQQLGRKMIETGVNQLMAQAFKGMGFQNPQQNALDRADAALARLDALNSAGINTPQAIVNAGSVTVNGEMLQQALQNAETSLSAVNTGPVTTGIPSGMFSGPGGQTLQLSPQDIIDLKKTVATEWVRSAGDAQGQGIIDTILNRQASGRWGNTVADVVNARSQFSDINGRPAWQNGRNSVDDLPMSRISPQVDRLVDDYLAQRAGGAQSSIGDHLNYANPNYSDRRNLGWINNLQGPVLGRGDAIHRHGTTPDLQQYRPGQFNVALPGQGQTPQVDTTAITGAVQQVNQATQQMGTSLQSVTPQLQQVGMTVQQTGMGVQMGTQQATTAMQQLNTAQQQTGQAATATGQQFQQAGQQIAAAGTQATSAAGGGGGAGFAGLASQIASAAGGGGAGAGGMGSIMSSMLPMLMQFLPPPFNLLGGLIGPLFGGLFADGGQIKGPGTGTSDSILAAVSNGEFIVNAKSTKEWGPVLQAINDNKVPKFAKGGQVGGGNIVGIGERAMSSGRKAGATEEVQELAGQVADLTKAVGRANGNGRGRISNNNMNVTVHAKDADSFRRSEGQLLGDAQLKISRFGNRNN